MSAPAQVTEAHRELAYAILFATEDGHAGPNETAQLIADSEARAVAEWQDSAHLKGAAIDSLPLECDRLRAEVRAILKIVNEQTARAERAEAELAFQVARNSDLFTQRDEAVEAQGKAEAELATERKAKRDLAQAELATERTRLRKAARAAAWAAARDAARDAAFAMKKETK